MAGIGSAAQSAGRYNGNASTSGNYRQYLQNVVKSDSYDPFVRAEAQALLSVVGNDFNINPAFEADPYKYTGTSTGHVVGNVGGKAYGYGPKGLNTVNTYFTAAYKNGSGAATRAGGSVGSRSGSSYNDTSAARNATQQAIDALGATQSSLDANEQDAYNKLMGQYSKEMATNQSDYDSRTKQNAQDLATARQLTRSTGAQGSRSLMAQLAALGANGTGISLANDAVSNQMNREFGESGDTANKNQTSLNTWIGRVKDADEERRGEARETLNNNLVANRNKVLQQKQSLLKQMAELWSQSGKNAEANNLIAQAGALNNDLASTARQPVSFTGKTIAYNAPELSGQEATGATVATVQPGSTTGDAGQLAVLQQKKRDDDESIYA